MLKKYASYSREKLHQLQSFNNQNSKTRVNKLKMIRNIKIRTLNEREDKML